MRLLMVEPKANGHFMRDIRFLSAEALSRGWDIHILTTETSANTTAYKLIEQECGQTVSTSFMENIERQQSDASSAKILLQNQYKQWEAFRNAFKTLADTYKPDFVLLVNLDHCDKILSVLGSPFGKTPFGGTMVQVKFYRYKMGVGPRSRQDRLYEFLFSRILTNKYMRVAFTLEEPFYQCANEADMPGKNKLYYTPNAAILKGNTSREQARASFGLEEDSIVILLYGMLDKRKSIPSLLTALADHSCPQNVIALMIGAMSKETEEYLENPQMAQLKQAGRIIVFPGYADNELEYRGFRVADIVWMGYSNHYGNSGVMSQAGAMGLPIIACRNGIIGWLAKNHDLGEVVDVSQKNEIIAAITKLAESPELRRKYGDKAKTITGTQTGQSLARFICDKIGAYICDWQ